MAFDFDFYKCALPGASNTMTDSAGCTTTRRDSITQPDELVLAYRDPAFATGAPADPLGGLCTSAGNGTFRGKVWGVTAASGSTVSLVLKPGDTIYRGQVLQIVCNDPSGVPTYAYATVSSAKTTGTAGSCTNPTLNLYTSGFSAYDPYNQPSALSVGCFSTGGASAARAYAVRRNRFFIRRDLSNTANPHPYLMLDQGLDLNDDGVLNDADLLPLATDILDFQVAYATEQPGIMALTTPPNGWVQSTYVVDSNTNGIWGDDPGRLEQLTEPVYPGAGNTPTTQFNAANAALYNNQPQTCASCCAAITFYQYPCLFGTSPVETSAGSTIQAYRWAAWPGNISQVLIAVIGTSNVPEELSQQSSDEKDLPVLLNRSALTAPAFNAWYLSLLPQGRKRVVVQTGVRPTNMAIASLFWN